MALSARTSKTESYPRSPDSLATSFCFEGRADCAKVEINRGDYNARFLPVRKDGSFVLLAEALTPRT